jgi:hypothetical protein
MLALLCGLAELGLNHNFWTDVVVGWAMGIAMAIYLVSCCCFSIQMANFIKKVKFA